MERRKSLVIVLVLVVLIRVIIRYNTYKPFQERTLQTVEKKSVTEGCSDNPVKHFVMTKTAKTGSSTLFTIFARFLVFNQLNMLTPTHERHIWWHSKESAVVGPRKKERADVLIHHAIFNKQRIDEYMQHDYKYIVTTREPVSWFISAANYFKKPIRKQLPANAQFPTPEEVVSQDELLYAKRDDEICSFYHLVQLIWSGFDYSLRNNLEAIRSHVEQVVDRADIIILTDQFDASLVLLKKKFCWDYIDIFYTKYTVSGTTNHATFSPKAVKKLLSREVNLGDKILYDELSEVWWKQPEVKEDSFWDEVKHFTELNINVTSIWCKTVLENHQTFYIPPTLWHDSLPLTTTFCDFLAKSKDEVFEAVDHYTGVK